MKKLMLAAGAAALLATPAFADLAAELSTGQTHAGMAATQTDIMKVHMHLQHAVNCLVGPSGTGFDASMGNPCAKAGVGNADLAAAQASAKMTADAIAAAK